MEKRLAEADRFTWDNVRGLIVAVGEFIVNANGHCAPAEPQFESLVEALVKQLLQRRLLAWLEQADSGRAADSGGDARLAEPNIGPVMDAASAATAASWAICGLALPWSHAKKRPSADSFADRIFPLIAPILGLRQVA